MNGGWDAFLALGVRTVPSSSSGLNELPPFRGGVAGLFGYGLSHAIERLPTAKYDEFHTPDLAVGWYDALIQRL